MPPARLRQGQLTGGVLYPNQGAAENPGTLVSPGRAQQGLGFPHFYFRVSGVPGCYNNELRHKRLPP